MVVSQVQLNKALEEINSSLQQALAAAGQRWRSWLMSKEKDPRLARAGVSGFNKPKRTPSHPKKSHVVVAKEGDKVKTIRFGQQGVSGDKKPTARQKSFKARHASNIAKGKMSAAYWADKVKW
jgi:hypothetical protein